MTVRRHTASNRANAVGNDPLTNIVWPFERNWISYRSSLANVDRRADLADVALVCGLCGCETDITPTPHSPRCGAA